ncbi:MAG: alpha/beta fold hydrolase [Gammaproteobacteria bacterium]
MLTMLLTIITTIAVVLGVLAALYFFATGMVFRMMMRLARRQAGLRLRHARVDGHDVPYLEGGEGPPLLLLHGFGANKDHWTMIAPYLSRHFHLYVPDLPGFGDASRVDDAHYGVDAQLGRVAEFADAVGLSRFHLAGNSMGGYLSALFAHRHPARVDSLWLLAPAGAMSAEPSEVLTRIDQGENPLIAETLEQFDALADLCFTVTPPMPGQFKRYLLERSKTEAPFNHRIFEHMFSEPMSLEDALDALPVRCLLVWGDNDRVLHPSGMKVIEKLLADVETVLMSRMGHVPMIERPAETAADYLRFRGIVE